MLHDLIHAVSACIIPLAIMSGLWLYASMRELTARLDRDVAQTECVRTETAHTRALTIVLAGEWAARALADFIRAGVLSAEDHEALIAEGRKLAALIATTASVAELDASVRAGLTRQRESSPPRPLKLIERSLT